MRAATSTCTCWMGHPESECTRRLKIKHRRNKDFEKIN